MRERLDTFSVSDRQAISFLLEDVRLVEVVSVGGGADAHHVYQIYLRAGNDEWSIYRRYSQFHQLHKELKKIDSAVSGFNFPPKKSFSNKVRFVSSIPQNIF